MIESINKEIELRHSYLRNEQAGSVLLDSIYLGGGTPSLLSQNDLDSIFNTISNHFLFNSNTEITLEANPDDLTKEKLNVLFRSPVNRLSIGVQSFFDDDLKFMNRAHNGTQALEAIRNSLDVGFENLTIDLMYALPTLTNDKWIENLQTVFKFPIPHLSCYNLTVEEGTALSTMIKKGKSETVSEPKSVEQYQILQELSSMHGFEQYEISNFARANRYSVHNSSYWSGKHYLGIGPSAHSFNGISRQWNFSYNDKYIKALQTNQCHFEKELLSTATRYNEYLLTGLRTKWGVNSLYISEQFGPGFDAYFQKSIIPFLKNRMLTANGSSYFLTAEGKLIADEITSELFFME